MLGRFKKIQNFIRLNNIDSAEAEVILNKRGNYTKRS